VKKVTTLEKEWFTDTSRERVGKTVAKVQSRWMSAALPEITVRLACNPRLGFGDWLDSNRCYPE
jgi:hypothetical protein